MDYQATTTQQKSVAEVGRLFCFVVLSTVGMAAMGVALLAEPLARYYRDRNLVATQQERVEQLQELRDQQEQLQANAEKPSVIEQAAINHLNYVPVNTATEIKVDLPGEWDQLQQALEAVENSKNPSQNEQLPSLISNLAQRPNAQILLLVLGAGLVVISLSCFYKKC
ncbi:MAG: hypothetical protein JXD22_07915 [Sedimentisphaerales bacterium]|nr:hypothetical protein [Sedimentisphaerales bacterium]